MFSNGIWKRARVAAMVVASGLLAAGAQAEATFTISGDLVQGSTFELNWADEGVAASTGVKETDVVIAFDPTMLQLLGNQPGSAFGAATVYAGPATLDDPLGLYTGWTVEWHTIVRDSPAPSYGTDVLSLQFRAVAPGSTSVLLLPSLTMAEAAAIPGYYGFAPGFDVAINDIAPVPEPTSLALMLAGLGVVAGATVRRQKAAASAA